MSKKREYIIVGWGLAGSILAWRCLQRGLNFSIIDSGTNHTSTVAAGLVNPVVFKRLTKSWEVDTLIPSAQKFYSELSDVLGYSLTSGIPINRVFASIEEQNNWAAMIGDDRFGSYTEKAADLENKYIKSPYGVGKVNSLGNIDVRKFLDASKKYLSAKGIPFQESRFDYSIDARKTYLFCEGAEVKNNPFFKYLPMKPTHGDILTIRSAELKLEEVVNKNMFVLPLGDDLYKVGATYNWEIEDAVPSEAGKEELIEKLKAFTSFSFEIVKHEAGIRPTVSDRRPLIGKHPLQENLYVFNGLGTKGVMIAPYFSNHLLDFIEEKGSLDEAVDIKRHEKHYNA
jgi:glycine/D-amino acid oxidase-like deaminating enzyme